MYDNYNNIEHRQSITKMIQGIQNLVFSQLHEEIKYLAFICTFKNFCQNADGNRKVFERANLACSQNDFLNNYLVSENIFTFDINLSELFNLKK